MCDKNCLKNILVVIVFIFLLAFIFAKFGPKLPISVVTQEKGQPLIVEGTGKVTVTPDIAKVTLGITESGSQLSSVQKSVDAKSKALTDSLKKLGIGEGDIKTTSYNVYPQYNFNNNPQTITGYQVSTDYEITVKNLDKVNDVIATSTSSGANIVGGISFDINDATKNEKLNEARKMAVDEAKTKAGGLAKAAGISLGKILNISENGVSPNPTPLMLPVAGGGNAKETSTPNVQPGTTELSVTVSLSYEIQ